MPILLSPLSLFCLIFIGCNGIAHSINDSIKDGVDDAKDALHKEDVQARSEYAGSYQVAKHHVDNPALQKMLFRLDSTIATGARYMDSISASNVRCARVKNITHPGVKVLTLLSQNP
jgi:hypothetical protein